MRFSFTLALRYLRAGGTQTLLMIFLVMAGITAYTFITAIVRGVRANAVENALGSSPHVTLEPFDRLPPTLVAGESVAATTLTSGQRPKEITDWPSVLKRVEGTPGVTVVSPVVTGSGFAIRGQQLRPITIQGGLTEPTEGIVVLRADTVQGQFELRRGHCVIGTELARRLGVRAGDRIRVQSETGDLRSLTIIGVVDAGVPQFDENTLFVDLGEAQTMLGKVGAITAVQLKVEEVFQASQVAQRLQDRTALDAIPWNRQNTQLMSLLQSQDLATGVVRGFALVTVALGVASVLSVTVTQKSKEIGILKSMGAAPWQIIASFVLLGALIGAIGGIGGGTLTYFVISFVSQAAAAAPRGAPSLNLDFQFEYIAQALVVAMVMASFGAVLPARRASRLDPVEAIRA